ncbi:ferredoxin [Actinoplanes sp. L3-i22]|uniref:ferredoxin n=1 Tax=Actinoplanes sp. L3-i22 TaxID=2836373 RepID=UPI001C84248A|nr:ferredoxin [Actinoplanes sp. L3-i22]
MRVDVDVDLCIGSGQCALTVPEIFDQDDDGVVLLLATTAPPELHDEVRDAASRCPVRAITPTDR